MVPELGVSIARHLVEFDLSYKNRETEANMNILVLEEDEGLGRMLVDVLEGLRNRVWWYRGFGFTESGLLSEIAKKGIDVTGYEPKSRTNPGKGIGVHFDVVVGDTNLGMDSAAFIMLAPELQQRGIRVIGIAEEHDLGTLTAYGITVALDKYKFRFQGQYSRDKVEAVLLGVLLNL
jgi:hypothetical protein